MQSKLKVVDNSGALVVKCIGVLYKGGKKVGKVGDIIVVSVKKVHPKSKIKKGSVQKAVIVRTKYGVSRNDGSRIRFDTNAVVLVNNQKDPLATRVFGPVTRELRQSNQVKITSLAHEVL